MLLVAAGASSALTLGRSQGVALIGRPLDMGIQMTLDAPNDVSDLCAEAEVFYGDNRVEARRVDLGTTASGTSATLRVRVSSPVDEAFVQVYLRVGCGAKFTRRYVLLSEQPGDVAEAAAVPTPVAPQAAQAVPAGVAPRPAAAVAGADAPAATRPPARAAAVVAALTAGGWYFWKRQRQQRQGAQPLGAQAAPDLELDLGQVVQVHAWEPDGTTHVTYRGAPWRARLQQSADLAQPEPGSYRICALQGNLLLLEKV